MKLKMNRTHENIPNKNLCEQNLLTEFYFAIFIK